MQRLTFTTLMVVSLLLGCAPSVDIGLGNVLEGGDPSISVNGVEVEPDILTAIRSGPLIDKSLGSCILSDFSLRPQPFLVEGSPFLVEGSPFLVEGSEGETTSDSRDAVLSSSLAAELESLSSKTASSSSVGILVLDEFGDTFTLDKQMFTVEEFLPETLVTFEAEGYTSHGALVSNHINGILSGIDGLTATRRSPDLIEWTNDAGGRILVKAAVPQDFETGSVAAALEQGVMELRAEGVDRIIVNMSFVILPCSIVREFVVQRVVYPSLFNYLGGVVEDNVERILAEQGLPAFARDEVAGRVGQAVIDSLQPVDPEGDPLRLVMLQEPGLVYVGAAGNFGRNVAAYPAAWDEVLAVSASEAGAKADFSNTGEVMFTGAWFRLTNPLGLNGHELTSSVVVYSGTSFAAPGVSSFLALDLLSASRCSAADGSLLLNGAGPDSSLELAVAERCR